jgi:hypothetical protein
MLFIFLFAFSLCFRNGFYDVIKLHRTGEPAAYDVDEFSFNQPIAALTRRLNHSKNHKQVDRKLMLMTDSAHLRPKTPRDKLIRSSRGLSRLRAVEMN